MIRIFKVRAHERALLFRDGVFEEVLEPRRHVRFDPLYRLQAEVVSVRDVWLKHRDLEVIARSGELDGLATVVDLKDHERALVWVDGRFEAVIGPGVRALWTVFHEVRVERLDARGVRFEHDQLDRVLEAPTAATLLDAHTVEAGHAGVIFKDGRHVATVGAGRYAFWKGAGKVALRAVDLRESSIDVAGQELMTADKVTIRLNAAATFRVVDALRAVTASDDHRQALYREAQLALRAVVGTRELDALLAEKDAVTAELEASVRARAGALGVEVVRIGIRDVILPGEMKDLLNKVTEANLAPVGA